MIKLFFYIILVLLLSFTVYSKDKNSDSIYKEEIKEFDNIINNINKDIKKEEKEINFLKNSLINNDISSSKLVVKLQNKDNSYFKILEAKITMNGNEIYNNKNIDKKNITIFNNSSDPGTYTFYFDLLVTGSGYGIFTYMKSYKFRVKRTIKVEVHSLGKSELEFIIYKKEGDNKHPENILGIKVKNDRS